MLTVRPDLYVSTQAQPDTALIDGALNSSWQRIGELDGSRETEAWGRVRPFVGVGGGSSKGVTFWADADAESEFVRIVTRQAPGISQGMDIANVRDMRFWLALDLSQYHHKFLITSARARFKATTRRPPEPHPGINAKPVLLPIQITACDGTVFRCVEA